MVVQLERFFADLDSVALEGDPEILRAHLTDASIVGQSAAGRSPYGRGDPPAPELGPPISGVRRYAGIGVVDATRETELTVESILIQDPEANDRRSMPSGDVLTGGDLHCADRQRPGDGEPRTQRVASSDRHPPHRLFPRVRPRRHRCRSGGCPASGSRIDRKRGPAGSNRSGERAYHGG